MLPLASIKKDANAQPPVPHPAGWASGDSAELKGTDKCSAKKNVKHSSTHKKSCNRKSRTGKKDLVRFQDAGDKVQTRLLNNWIDEHQKSSDGLTQILSWSSVREYKVCSK